MSERDRWIYELGQRHPNLAFEMSDAYVERRGKDKDEIAKLNTEIGTRNKQLEAMWEILNKVSTPFDRGLHPHDFQAFSEIFDTGNKVREAVKP